MPPDAAKRWAASGFLYCRSFFAFAMLFMSFEVINVLGKC